MQTLRRIKSEADHHKMLDIFYIIATFIGLFNVIKICIETYIHGNYIIGGNLMAVIFVITCLSGALGYIWHIKGEVYKERAIIIPIVIGLFVGSIGSFLKFSGTIPTENYAPSLEGMSIGLVTVLVIEGIERLYKVNTRLKQLAISKDVRAKAAQRDPQDISRKAAEVISKHEANK